MISALRQAFEYPQLKGVIVAINSPGGSPVQAGQIYDELRRLRAKHPDKRAVAVVGDMAASGGHYVAAGADRIYVDKASLVGSIGVIMQGFGFAGAIDKLGIERRVITSGERKGFLDPFRPLEPADETHIRGILDEVHGQFIKAVYRRGQLLRCQWSGVCEPRHGQLQRRPRQRQPGWHRTGVARMLQIR